MCGRRAARSPLWWCPWKCSQTLVDDWGMPTVLALTLVRRLCNLELSPSANYRDIKHCSNFTFNGRRNPFIIRLLSDFLQYLIVVCCFALNIISAIVEINRLTRAFNQRPLNIVRKTHWSTLAPMSTWLDSQLFIASLRSRTLKLDRSSIQLRRTATSLVRVTRL